MAFAEGTEVSVDKTQQEIQTLVRKHGATEFAGGWTKGEAGLSFVIKGRRVQFSVKIPDGLDPKIRQAAGRMRGYLTNNLPKAVAAEERRLWRCLLLAIKAKLEIVASGIATFEEEFLAHIVTDDGRTVYDRIRFPVEGAQRLLGPADGAP
jgi:hypothetical protein